MRLLRCPTLCLVASALCLSAGCTLLSGGKDGGTMKLFNGENLDGWGYYLVEPDVKMEDVWSVEDGILVCKGEPMGYLATEGEYTNYNLVVEWRWAPESDPAKRNSGVLLRITGEPKKLPRCMEAQLKSGAAGNLYGFEGFRVVAEPGRTETDPTKYHGFHKIDKLVGNENPVGEWNRYDITVLGGAVNLSINGKPVNHALDSDVVAGKIGLQSEGAEIHFRTVQITPLEMPAG